MLTRFCDSNDIDLYLNNSNPISKDIYLKYYSNIKGLNLKNDLINLDIDKEDTEELIEVI